MSSSTLPDLGGVGKITQDFRETKSLTGEGLVELGKKVDKLTGLVTIIERDNRGLRQNLEVVSVRVSRYLPMNSVRGMRRLFRVNSS